MKKTAKHFGWAAIIFIALIAIFSLSGCVLGKSGKSVVKLTKNQRKAQKKLRKAIILDPNIIAKDTTNVTIDSSVIAHYDSIIKGYQLSSKSTDCDSLLKALKNGPVILASDASDTMEAEQDPKDSGKIIFKYIRVPIAIHDTFKVPFKVTVSIPGKVIKQYAEYPIWHYSLFWWVLVIGVLIFIAFILKLLNKF